MTNCNLNGDEEHEVYFVPEVRKELIPTFSLKKDEESEKEPPFVHENSIFKDWKTDSSGTLTLALKADLGYWKAAKFIKDTEDQKKCKSVVTKYF